MARVTDPDAAHQTVREVPMMLARSALSAAFVAVTVSACVFDVNVGASPERRPLSRRPFDGPIDILFVVDNSGSMTEEQARLADALWGEDCPISDLNAVPSALMHPDEETERALLEQCGLAQMLAAYDRDFHLGVITTTVNACDNLLPSAMGGWERGFRPQRGCLQPVPGSGAKVLTRDDPDVALNFVRLLSDLGTFGSPWERGLDAAEIFLGGESWVAPGCEGDRELFLRPEAELLVVFVTDEDDCSHLGADDFVDETSTVCGEDPSFFVDHNAVDCYAHADALNPVERTVEALRRVKGPDRPVRAAVIGGVGAADGVAIGEACFVDAEGASALCYESGGLSNATSPGAPCAEDTAAARDGLPCCTADAAHRYVALRDALGGSGFSASSICAADYRLDLLEAAIVAQFDE